MHRSRHRVPLLARRVPVADARLVGQRCEVHRGQPVGVHRARADGRGVGVCEGRLPRAGAVRRHRRRHFGAEGGHDRECGA